MAELEQEIHRQERFAQSCQPEVPSHRPLSPAPWPDCRVSCPAGRTTLPCLMGSSTRGCPRSPWRSRGAARHRAQSCTPSTSSWASATARTQVSHQPFPLQSQTGQGRDEPEPFRDCASSARQEGVCPSHPGWEQALPSSREEGYKCASGRCFLTMINSQKHAFGFLHVSFVLRLSIGPDTREQSVQASCQ